jgi:hypothetical protein
MMSISLKGIAMQKTVYGLLFSLMVLPAWAQPPSDAPAAKPHGKVAAKAPVKAHVKTAVSKIAKAPVKPATAVLPAALAALPMAEAHMGVDELAIAERVHKGRLSCELGASVRLEADASNPGYFDLHGKGFHYHMHPVATSTGAIRLEDKQAGAVWLQLANKSMLMDQNKGRRIADECAHPEQMAYAQDMKNNPPPQLFDTTGMGR